MTVRTLRSRVLADPTGALHIRLDIRETETHV